MQRYSASSNSYQHDDRPSGSLAVDEAPERFKAPPVQLTTWTHEAKNCPDDVVINLSLLPAGAKEGDVAELKAKKKKVLFIVKKPTEEFCKLVPNLQVSRYASFEE